MRRTFIQTREFSKQWDRLGFDDDDLRRLEAEILFDPKQFPVMQGTGGLRKMRFAYRNEGKSGSVRVCYVDFVVAETIYLITAYPKNKKDNLSAAECGEIRKVIDALRNSLEEHYGKRI